MPEAGALSGPSESRTAAWRLYRMWGVPFRASCQRLASAWVREYHRAPPAECQSGPVRPVLIPGSSSSSHWETESFGTRGLLPVPGGEQRELDLPGGVAVLGDVGGGDGAHRQEGVGLRGEAVGELHRLSGPEKVVGAGALLRLLGEGAQVRVPGVLQRGLVQDRPLGLTGEDMPAPQNAQKDQQDPGQKKRQTLMGGKSASVHDFLPPCFVLYIIFTIVRGGWQGETERFPVFSFMGRG